MAYEINSTTLIPDPDTNINLGGLLDNMRSPSMAGMWFHPDGDLAAVYGRNKSTQQWNLTVIDTSDVTGLSEAGNLNLTGAIISTPVSSPVEAIWCGTRDRLWVPNVATGGTHDIAIYDMSASTPVEIAPHPIVGASGRSYIAFRWSANKTCIYAVGDDVFAVLTPSGSGDSFTEDIITTGSFQYRTLAHDGTTIVCARRSSSPVTTAGFLVLDINPADETDVTLRSSELVACSGLITAAFLGGFPQWATFQNDVFGCWWTNVGVAAAAQYVTFDFSDLDNPAFDEELRHLVDPDNSIASTPSYIYDYGGNHSQIFVGDVVDEPTQSKGFSVVGYL